MQVCTLLRTCMRRVRTSSFSRYAQLLLFKHRTSLIRNLKSSGVKIVRPLRRSFLTWVFFLPGFRFHSTGRMLSTSAACRRRLTLGLWLRCGIPWGWGEKFILWRRPNCYRFPSIVILEYFLCSYLLQRFNRQSSGQALIAHLKRRLMEICSTPYPDFRNVSVYAFFLIAGIVGIYFFPELWCIFLRLKCVSRLLSSSALEQSVVHLWVSGLNVIADCSFNESSLSWLGRQRGIIRKWLVINIIYILTICILIIYKPVIQRGIIRRWLVCRWRGWLGGSWRKEVQKNI